MPPRPAASAAAQRALRLARHLPLWVLHGLGGALGAAAAALPGRPRHVTQVNLELCLPELGPRERRRLGRRSLRQTGRAACELAAMWGWERERLLALVREVRGEEHLARPLAEGRGVILASPHLGCWEIAGLYVSSRYPITTLYRPPRMREMEEVYRRGRERFGARLVPAGPAGVRALHRALERGELVGVLPDQDPGRGAGIFVPFFGRPANTMVLIPRLAARARAAVVLIYAERLPGALGFRIHLRPAPEGIYEADLERSAAALNAGVEACVRELPEQYLWSYKRFRVAPPGAADPYH